MAQISESSTNLLPSTAKLLPDLTETHPTKSRVRVDSQKVPLKSLGEVQIAPAIHVISVHQSEACSGGTHCKKEIRYTADSIFAEAASAGCKIPKLNPKPYFNIWCSSAELISTDVVLPYQASEVEENS